MDKVQFVAHKWWKVWYARPLTAEEKEEYNRDIQSYEVDRNDVMIEMMKIRNNIV